MALALAYASYVNFGPSQKKIMGLAALLHDTGKTVLNPYLHTALKKLAGKSLLKCRTILLYGYNILRRYRFQNDKIKNIALRHH